VNERLWAPWRSSYVQAESPKPAGGCVFCDAVAGGPAHDREHYVLARGKHVFAILNVYPYNPGHLMIVPFDHLGDLSAADRETVAEMMAMAQDAVRALRAAMNPGGFNLGMNLGTPGGAGITDHIHLHVVPRWGGDTNFISVVGDTRVLPQALLDTYDVLRPALEKVLQGD